MCFYFYRVVRETCMVPAAVLLFNERTSYWRERGSADKVLHWLLFVASGHEASNGQTKAFDLLCSLSLHTEMNACAHRNKLRRLHRTTFLTLGSTPMPFPHAHTHTCTCTPCIMVFVSSSCPAPIWWQRSRQVPQMTIEIELTDESSSKTLAVMVLQLRLTAHISPWWLWCPASPRHLQEWAAWRSC